MVTITITRVLFHVHLVIKFMKYQVLLSSELKMEISVLRLFLLYNRFSILSLNGLRIPGSPAEKQLYALWTYEFSSV